MEIRLINWIILSFQWKILCMYKNATSIIIFAIYILQDRRLIYKSVWSDHNFAPLQAVLFPSGMQ